MIKVIVLDHHGEPMGFKISGHANYGPAGTDIVCAAVSILSQTAVLALEKVAGASSHWSRKDGFLSCQVDENTQPERLASAQVVLKTLLVGLENVAEQYPSHVTIVKEEV